jgi:peptidoglycan/xylan/chitin deacetylase (PgdA/CDA1 family)
MENDPIEFPQTFEEWHQVPTRARLRLRARSAALSALYLAYRASGALARGLATPRVQFFCLHHVFEDEEAPFRRLLERLSHHFDFVSWSEGVRMVLSGQAPPRPVACFSSDDGLASNLVMARVLEEFGATGCFFINPASLDSTDDAFAARFCRLRLQARPARFLSVDDTEGLLRSGHEIGNHTLTHVVCSETPTERLEAEIVGAQEALQSRFGPVLHFAWPYGQYTHFSEAARSLVFESGHVSASSVIRGAHLVGGGSPFKGDLCIRRDQVWARDPVEHILYFTARNALHPELRPDSFPRLVDGLERTGTPDPASTGPDGVRLWSGLEKWDAIPLPATRVAASQYAPSPLRAARTVRSRTARSSQMDQFRT